MTQDDASAAGDQQQHAVGELTGDSVTGIRQLLESASKQLLGNTITLGDEEWYAATGLPGWTRAHVATHVCRHADAFARLARGARTGVPQPMYPNPRDAEIDTGATRAGLALQTDLDTSTEELDEQFDRVADAGAWEETVQLRNGRTVPAHMLPLGRLAEVVIHHHDLGIGFTVADLDERTAEWCLRWCAFRLAPREDFPTLSLQTSTGACIRVGAGGAPPAVVRGAANLLLGWLTRQTSAEGLSGAGQVELPSFG